MTALLSIRGLCKAYGALKVTDGIDLDLTGGEVHAIIGPNGAGKTTFVAQLAGQIRQDSGAIHYDGRNVSHTDMAGRVRLGMARSFQITSILPGFSVLDNVAMAVQARSGSSFRFFRAAAKERALNDAALEYLDQVGLAGRAGEVARNLSHGEHRQMEIAMALATRPKVLLLDEPFAGTGQQEAKMLLRLLQGLRGNLTMLLIEHDMNAVFALADRVSVMVYGRLIATGTPTEVRANPEVRAAYLGDEAPQGAT